MYVGSCASATDNILCGPVEDAPFPVVRDCPGNTYGRYITFIRSGTSVQLELCEIIIHGKNSKFQVVRRMPA